MDISGIDCPSCRRSDHQVKAGRYGEQQRYKCGVCGRRYIAEPHQRGYTSDVRSQARQYRADGLTIHEIALKLGVSARSVANWTRVLPEAPAPAEKNPSPSIEESAPVSGRPYWRRSTIHDVAKHAQVSISTISNYLNQRGRMSEATGDRIQAAIDELYFTPSALTRAIQARRTHILGVYIGGLDILDENMGDAISLPLLAGLHRGAGVGNHNLLHFTSYNWRTNGQMFLDGQIDGLVWVAPPMQSPALDRLVAAGLPVVTLLTRHVPEGVGFVNADNIGAMRDMTVHLASLGRRRIAFVGTVHDSNHWDRREGYRQGLKAANLPWSADLEIQPYPEDEGGENIFDPARGVDQTIDHLLSLSDPPNAILLSDDSVALLVGQGLQQRGVRIPEEIMIAGFNDNADSKQGLGGLTTIRQPLRMMGEKAAEYLVAMIGGAPASECRLTLPVELIFRATTATSGR